MVTAADVDLSEPDAVMYESGMDVNVVLSMAMLLFADFIRKELSSMPRDNVPSIESHNLL